MNFPMTYIKSFINFAMKKLIYEKSCNNINLRQRFRIFTVTYTYNILQYFRSESKLSEYKNQVKKEKNWSDSTGFSKHRTGVQVQKKEKN